MSKKMKYVPPVAELILLTPCEHLAAWEYSFKNTWKSHGRFETASDFNGIAFGGDKFDAFGEGGDFFTKSSTTS